MRERALAAAEGAILEVVRKGYWIDERVLRHAQVHVVGVDEPEDPEEVTPDPLSTEETDEAAGEEPESEES